SRPRSKPFGAPKIYMDLTSKYSFTLSNYNMRRWKTRRNQKLKVEINEIITAKNQVENELNKKIDDLKDEK
ncbi:16965_t:CDS:2, partial [Gigaspora rosea]